MNQEVRTISVVLRRSHSGLFAATSDDLPGVYMAHCDRAAIIADLPAVVSRWFKNNTGTDIDVSMREPVRNDGSSIICTISVTAEPTPGR